jgi:hypothetical protein
MIEFKDYFEVLEDATKMEKTVISVGLYNKTRGGGILWAIFYWLSYFLSVYFIHSHLFKGIPNLLELITFISLFFIGCFLTYGVIRQLFIMRYWHKQQREDFIAIHNKLIETTGNELMSSQKFQDLNNLILRFEQKYFPKKVLSLAAPVGIFKQDL